MSISPNLSKQVSSFIQKHVPIVEVLHILLALHQSPGKLWTLDDLTRETRVSGTIAAGCISLLQTEGLIKEHESCYHYAPASPELAQAVDALAQAYVERPVSVIRAIYSPASKIQDLADAFRIKE